MLKSLQNIFNKQIIISIAIVICGIVIYFILKKFIKKIIEKQENNSKMTRKRKTYAKLFSSILKYLMIILVIISILQVNGVNVSSLVAGLGLASAIVGLALQDALKDIVMGVNIIVDDYFSVGDVLKIKDIEGKVIEVGLKTTKLKDVNTNDVFVIANRNIGEALRLSNQLDIDIPLPYEENVTEMEEILHIAMKKIQKLEHVTNIEYRGLQHFGDSAIYYKLRLYCKPDFKAQTKRDANRIIKLELDANNIEIPYMQVDIHNC